jgi:outer membrane protein assembly factor BamB
LLTVISCSTRIDSQWKGPFRNGIYPEKGLLQEWGENGPDLIWRYDSLYMGHSSPAVTKDAIYLTGMPDSTSGYIFCLNHNGELLWKDLYGEEYKSAYTGSRSTPTIVGDKLYLLSGAGEVICYDLKNRKKVWSKSYVRDFNSTIPQYGFAESLLVDGDKLFCTVGNEVYNVICLNRQTGELIWSCDGNKEPAKSSSPILVNHNGKKLLITVTMESILGINPAKGNLMWRIPFEPIIFHFVNTPVYKDGIVYMAGTTPHIPSTTSKSDSTKGGFIAIKLNEDGTNASILWRRNLSNLMAGYVVKDTCLYTSIYRKKVWYCLNALTGETEYTWEGSEGTISYADNRFYILGTMGSILLCEGSSKDFKTVGKFKLDIKPYYPFALLWAPPVIKNKKLYIRHKGSLFVYDIAEKVQ